MTISYTLQPIPRWVFNDLTGKPAAGGKLFVRSSLNPTQSKLVYQDAAGTIPWTDPIIFDENGTAPGPFYWKIDDGTPEDLYYLIFTDNQGATTSDPGNVIWSEPVYPISGGGGGGGGGTTIQKIENIFVNSSFINNIGNTVVTPIQNNTFLCPGAHSGLYFPDIRYVVSGLSNASDTITFVPFTTDPGIGINPIFPDFLSDYYLRYECLNSPTGEVYKGIQIPISKFVNDLSNQTFTLTFYARKTAGSGNQLNFFIYQYYGTGGSPSVSTPVDIVEPRTLTSSFVLYSINFTIPSTLGKTLGNSNDDGTYLQIRYPTGTTTTIDIFKPMLFVGSSYPTIIYESNEETEVKIETPRTGDIKTSSNPFSNSPFYYNQNGWIPLNDGTIGNASSNATTRAKSDSWLLYKLIWENTIESNCPLYDSSGATVSKGGSAISDWNANYQLSLPRSVERVVANRGSNATVVNNYTCDATTDVLTISSPLPSYFRTGNVISLGTSAPAPLAVGVTYYAIVLTSTTIKLAFSAEAAIAGTFIDLTTSVSGTVNTPPTYELGKFQGENAHQQTINEMSAHTHTPLTGNFVTDAPFGGVFGGGGLGQRNGTTQSQGGSKAFNLVQPTVFYNMIIKL